MSDTLDRVVTCMRNECRVIRPPVSRLEGLTHESVVDSFRHGPPAPRMTSRRSVSHSPMMLAM